MGRFVGLYLIDRAQKLYRRQMVYKYFIIVDYRKILFHHDFSTLFIERMTFLHAPWSSHVSLKDLIKARSKVHTISILLILGNLCILLRRWEILFVIISSKIFIVVYIRDVSSRTPCTKIYLQPQQGYLEFPKLLQITGQK